MWQITFVIYFALHNLGETVGLEELLAFLKFRILSVDDLHGIHNPWVYPHGSGGRRFAEGMRVDDIAMDTGCVTIRIQVDEKCYYEMLSDLVGTEISGEYELVRMMNGDDCLRDHWMVPVSLVRRSTT